MSRIDSAERVERGEIPRRRTLTPAMYHARQPSTSQLLTVALAFDADDLAVREQVAAWLALHGAYGQGAAASLLRHRRHPVYVSTREVA